MQHRNRAFLILVLIACAFTVVSLKLVQIQLIDHDKYEQIALLKHFRPIAINPPRGAIIDCEGRPLVQTQSVSNVYLDPHLLHHGEEQLPLLAVAANVPVADLQKRYNERNRHWLLAENLDGLAVDRLKALKLGRGMMIDERDKRVYLNDGVAAHVLGFYDEGGHGIGVEKQMNACLAGIPGKRWVEQDSHGREIAEFSGMDTPAQDGDEVQLTLNLNIQHAVEDEMDQLVQKYQPDAAYVIVMQPQTGAVLAMASRPTFNPNNRATYQPDLIRNRCITDMVEPGSIFKIITVAAGLNEGLFDLNTQVFCQNGVFNYLGFDLKDDEPHGMLSVRDCLAYSSNIGIARLALVYLHEKMLYEYAQRFGIGQHTGLLSDGKDVQGESVGLLRPLAKWSGLSITRIPIGQEVAATPMQMITAMCVIANGGRLVAPQLISEVHDAAGNLLKSYRPRVVRQVISPNAAHQVTRALEAVVSEGTAKNTINVPGIIVAGKTATAQKFVNGTYSHTEHVASFLGFFPADDPQAVMLVMVDNPKTKNDYGKDVAAPAFSILAGQIVQILNIPQDQPISTVTPTSLGAAAL